MLTIKQGPDLLPAVDVLECGECFLYEGKHYRKISTSGRKNSCYNFTDNYTVDLDEAVRVRRMPLILSEERAPADTATIYFTGCHENADPKAKFIVDFVTFNRHNAIQHADAQDQRKNTWCVFEAEVGDEFHNWEQIHTAKRGTD
jgi:hypothetical protein